MKKRAIFVIASVVLIAGLLLAGFGCAGEAPPTEGPPTEGPPTEGPPEAKTLKIGCITSLNWAIGTDTVKGLDLDVEKTNAEGGLLIGGERYMLETVVDDIKMDPALAKTAAEKEIFQDKVDFIFSDLYCSSFLDLCEENKVVLVGWPVTFEILDPKYHYCFSSSYHYISWVSLLGWVADKFPEFKTCAMTFPDRIDGHAYADIWGPAAEAFGITPEFIFYNAEATDQSAVGTKVKTDNPDFLVPYGGGPDVDSVIIKACRVAGYDGQIIDTAPIPAGFFLAFAGPEASEGLIAGAWPVEFEPALTDMAKEFKADWIAKYGEWTDPEEAWVIPWWILKAGLEGASSPDPDDVAAVIGGGLKFECPLGDVEMISRPDYNNPRTVQAMAGLYVKQIVGGKATEIDYLDLAEQYDYAKIIYGW